MLKAERPRMGRSSKISSSFKSPVFKFTLFGLIAVIVSAALEDKYWWSVAFSILGLASFIIASVPGIVGFAMTGLATLGITGLTPLPRPSSGFLALSSPWGAVGAIAVVVAAGNSIFYSSLEGHNYPGSELGLVPALYQSQSRSCVPQLRLGGSGWSDSYESGGPRFPIPPYYVQVSGSLVPKRDGATASGYVFGKAWYIFWTRWGEISVDLSLTVSCRGKCSRSGGKCVAEASTYGNSAREDGIVKAVFDSKAAPVDDRTEWIAELSGSLGASGGPSGEIGVVKIAWPDATAQNTFQAGTYNWFCECEP